MQAADEARCVAEACERADQAELERDEVAMCAAHLWSLLNRAAETVEAQIAKDDGGAWDTLTLAYELRQALEVAPPTLGRALLSELHAARVGLRAAGALAAAQQAGDPEQVARCLAAFELASRAYQAAARKVRAAATCSEAAGSVAP